MQSAFTGRNIEDHFSRSLSGGKTVKESQIFIKKTKQKLLNNNEKKSENSLFLVLEKKCVIFCTLQTFLKPADLSFVALGKQNNLYMIFQNLQIFRLFSSSLVKIGSNCPQNFGHRPHLHFLLRDSNAFHHL